MWQDWQRFFFFLGMPIHSHVMLYQTRKKPFSKLSRIAWGVRKILFCVTLVLTRASSIKTPASDNSQRFLLCIFRRLQILIWYSCEFELIILNLLRRYMIWCSLRHKNCQNPEATIDLLVELIFLLERLGCKENCWHRRCLTSQKQERIQYLHSLFRIIFVSFLIRLLSFHNYPFCVIKQSYSIQQLNKIIPLIFLRGHGNESCNLIGFRAVSTHGHGNAFVSRQLKTALFTVILFFYVNWSTR